jgi:hypothetical protein
LDNQFFERGMGNPIIFCKPCWLKVHREGFVYSQISKKKGLLHLQMSKKKGRLHLLSDQI